MELDPAELTPRERYGWLIASIVPRPIAFVSTRSMAGVDNIAPFSYYVGVSSSPPTVALSFGDSKTGRPKDTLANILATNELVINLATAEIAQQLVQTSAPYPPETSEFAATGLEPAPSTKVKPPRLASAPIAMECTHVAHHKVGNATLVLVEIIHLHVDTDVLGDDGLPDPEKLDPLARLGGIKYAGLGPVFEIPRPRL